MTLIGKIWHMFDFSRWTPSAVQDLHREHRETVRSTEQTTHDLERRLHVIQMLTGISDDDLPECAECSQDKKESL